MFVPLQVVAAIGAALEPADSDNVVPAEIADLGSRPTVTAGHQNHGCVSMTVAIGLGRLDQLLDLGLGQVLPRIIDLMERSIGRAGTIHPLPSHTASHSPASKFCHCFPCSPVRQ
jgi:hypothetical protein